VGRKRATPPPAAGCCCCRGDGGEDGDGASAAGCWQYVIIEKGQEKRCGSTAPASSVKGESEKGESYPSHMRLPSNYSFIN
jgi:hypothetical protein